MAKPPRLQSELNQISSPTGTTGGPACALMAGEGGEKDEVRGLLVERDAFRLAVRARSTREEYLEAGAECDASPSVRVELVVVGGVDTRGRDGGTDIAGAVGIGGE